MELQNSILGKEDRNLGKRLDIKEYIFPFSTIELVGKYILGRYNDQIYPEIVLDSKEVEVYLRCMHRVGKYVNEYSLYWTIAVQNECW